MRACWLKWVGRDWSISADYIWLNYSGANNAKEESFSIDADNQSFPPSISGIQNGIVAYAMNQREWKTDGAKVNLTATSNVTKESNSKWNA